MNEIYFLKHRYRYFKFLIIFWWQRIIYDFRTFGDSKHLRKLFPRALQGTKDRPEIIGKAWLNYERDEGTLESLDNCIKKITAKMKEVKEEQEKDYIALASEEIMDYPKKKSKKNRNYNQNEGVQVGSMYESEKRKIIGYKRKHADFDDESSLKKNKPSSDISQKEETKDHFINELLNESKKSM